MEQGEVTNKMVDIDVLIIMCKQSDFTKTNAEAIGHPYKRITTTIHHLQKLTQNRLST